MQSLLRRLLADPAVEVRRAATRSVARRRLLELVPDLLETLLDRSVRVEARAALPAYGEALLLRIRPVLRAEQTPAHQLERLTRILADIGGSDAAA